MTDIKSNEIQGKIYNIDKDSTMQMETYTIQM